VRHRADIQELIERSEWDALQKRLTEGGSSGGVRSLNEALIPIVKDKRLDQQAATRCAYDRADLARKLREVAL
jgi:Tfp pilus assembly pilus retraction ATPase PilT